MLTYHYHYKSQNGDIIDGTAEKLCKEAYNGYIKDIPSLQYILDRVREEQKLKRTGSDYGNCSSEEIDEKKLLALIEEAQEEEKYPNAPYSVGRMKFNILSGYTQFEEFDWYSDETKTIELLPIIENQAFIFGISEINAESTGSCACSIPVEEFMQMNHESFEQMLNACYFYNMQYEELEEHDDK